MSIERKPDITVAWQRRKPTRQEARPIVPVTVGATASRSRAAAILELAFSGASQGTLHALADVARVRPVARGAMALAQGGRLRLTIPARGLFSIGRIDADGRRYTLALLRPGEVYGVRGISGRHVSSVEVVAASDGELIELPPAVVRRLAEHDAGLAMALVDHASALIGTLMVRLDQMMFDSARKRLATAILINERVLDSKVGHISRSELAGLIGTSGEMLRAVLRDFEANGIARREDDRIHILDRGRLREIAGIRRPGERRALLDDW